MLEEAILNLAAQEDWTDATIRSLLTDFISEKGLDDECMAFLETKTAEALLEECD